MKILFITSDIPYPPTNGIRIVLYNILKLLAPEHTLSLMVLTDEPHKVKEQDVELLRTLCEEVTVCSLKKRARVDIAINAVLRSKLFFVERYRDKSFQNLVDRKIESWAPDVVHFDMIRMSQYGLSIDPQVPKIASINDSYALTAENEQKNLPWKRWPMKLYKYVQVFFTKRYESKVLSLYDCCHVVSAVDGQYLNKLNAAINIKVIANGVDETLLEPLGQRQQDACQKILFISRVAGMSHLEEFLIHSWSTIKQEVKQAEVLVAGNMPSPKLRQIAEKIGGVSFLGFVPDLKEFYLSGMISVVPIRKNHGILNKALEAMAMGLAVAGFEESFAGIPQAHHEVNCMLGKNYTELSCQIIDLLTMPDKAKAVGDAARKLVLDHYTWSGRKKDFECLYQSAIECHENESF